MPKVYIPALGKSVSYKLTVRQTDYYYGKGSYPRGGKGYYLARLAGQRDTTVIIYSPVKPTQSKFPSYSTMLGPFKTESDALDYYKTGY